jgi:hypothetical protein
MMTDCRLSGILPEDDVAGTIVRMSKHARRIALDSHETVIQRAGRPARLAAFKLIQQGQRGTSSTNVF